MDQDKSRLFEEFDEAARVPPGPTSPGEFTVRPAQLTDVEALGRISAEREGGDAREQRAGFQSALENAGAGHTFIILVAELGGDVVGFGKVRYLDGKHGAGEGDSPEGWYLTGVVVDPGFRGRGVGSSLTAKRLDWIAERSGVAYYFSNASNRVSMALHERFGFTELARGPEFCGITFVGGEGVLFQADLSSSERRAP